MCIRDSIEILVQLFKVAVNGVLSLENLFFTVNFLVEVVRKNLSGATGYEKGVTGNHLKTGCHDFDDHGAGERNKAGSRQGVLIAFKEVNLSLIHI